VRRSSRQIRRWLIAFSAFSRPDDTAAVPRADDRIADVSLVQAAVDDVGEERRVSPEEYRELDAVLAELPDYEADEEGALDVGLLRRRSDRRLLAGAPVDPRVS